MTRGDTVCPTLLSMLGFGLAQACTGFVQVSLYEQPPYCV